MQGAFERCYLISINRIENYFCGDFISVILDGVWYDDYYTVGDLEIE